MLPPHGLQLPLASDAYCSVRSVLFIYIFFKMDISDRFLLDQKQQQQISILLLAGPQASGACSHYDVQCQKGALQIMTLLYFSIAA